MAERIKFWLNGCDIAFIAEAPEDITLKQLLKQCDRIRPEWCACGICSLGKDDDRPAQIAIDYDGIRKVDDAAPCKIEDDVSWWDRED